MVCINKNIRTHKTLIAKTFEGFQVNKTFILKVIIKNIFILKNIFKQYYTSFSEIISKLSVSLDDSASLFPIF